MSCIKRWIEDACERIANDTGYNWDEIMEAAASVDFDMRLIDYLAHSYQLNSFMKTRRKKS